MHSKLVNQKINLEIINLSYIQSSVEYQLDINNLDHDSLNQSKVVSSTALINNFKFKILEPISTRLSAIYFDNKTLNGTQYSWTFGDSTTSELVNPSHTYTEVGAYEVVLMTATQYGCRDTVRGIVRIEYGFNFYVPTAFTPNNDGVNDNFQGYGTYIKNYEMGIYNLWGQLVYHTTDYSKPWDGTSKGRPVPVGTYYYVIDLKTGKEPIVTGSVTIIR